MHYDEVLALASSRTSWNRAAITSCLKVAARGDEIELFAT